MATSAHEFPWPPLSEGGALPRWSNGGFWVGDTFHPILSYGGGSSGWTDDLTAFHDSAAGENHPIDVFSRWNGLAMLKRSGLRKSATILEIGCSSGFMLRELRAEYPSALLIGADYIEGPLVGLASAHPDIPILQFDLTMCPLPDKSVDAIVILNVLEHIDDDAVALSQLARILKPGGVAVIEVPAGPRLFDAYDKLLLHRRRYSMSMLQSLVVQGGLAVMRAGHLGCFLYPAFRLAKMRNQRHQNLDDNKMAELVRGNIATSRNQALMWPPLALEYVLGQFVSLPFGIRCVLLARKPE